MHHQHYLLYAFYLLLWKNARTSHMQEHSKQIRPQKKQLIPLIGAEARRSNNEQFVVVE
jgi:hypothetical protein